MKKHLLTLVLALVVGVVGFAVSGIAVASNGKPPGGQNPCPPSQHAVYDQDGNFVSCQDNGNPSGEPGGGIGNCVQSHQYLRFSSLLCIACHRPLGGAVHQLIKRQMTHSYN